MQDLHSFLEDITKVSRNLLPRTMLPAQNACREISAEKLELELYIACYAIFHMATQNRTWRCPTRYATCPVGNQCAWPLQSFLSKTGQKMSMWSAVAAATACPWLWVVVVTIPRAASWALLGQRCKALVGH